MKKRRKQPPTLNIPPESFGWRRGFLHLRDEGGTVRVPVIVEEETKRQYLIRAIRRMQIPGRLGPKWLDIGNTAKVPKKAVSFDE